MAMSVIDNNVRGISDLISAVNMSQSTHADVNLANHISNESKYFCLFSKILNNLFKEIGRRNLALNKVLRKFYCQILKMKRKKILKNFAKKKTRKKISKKMKNNF